MDAHAHARGATRSLLDTLPPPSSADADNARSAQWEKLRAVFRPTMSASERKVERLARRGALATARAPRATARTAESRQGAQPGPCLRRSGGRMRRSRQSGAGDVARGEAARGRGGGDEARRALRGAARRVCRRGGAPRLLLVFARQAAWEGDGPSGAGAAARADFGSGVEVARAATSAATTRRRRCSSRSSPTASASRANCARAGARTPRRGSARRRRGAAPPPPRRRGGSGGRRGARQGGAAGGGGAAGVRARGGGGRGAPRHGQGAVKCGGASRRTGCGRATTAAPVSSIGCCSAAPSTSRASPLSLLPANPARRRAVA